MKMIPLQCILSRSQPTKSFTSSAKSANFFKHADRDPDDILDFDPEMNEFYILYAIAARQICGETQSQEEADFMWWFSLQRPSCLTDAGRKMLSDRWPTDVLEYGRGLTRREFFAALRKARATIDSNGSQIVVRRSFHLPSY